ncbi:hypothetical protein Clacol_002039 [Clathrus columnatus]|uniref:Glutathione synthetase n=1 Tax=Clathrus columnatus TaxID=1419009 RepID=A0AAV5A3J9_9AGAM|nr:hypothetical protein Clacol_002039 [Clathrus columnatus]
MVVATSKWPPQLTESQLDSLSLLATTYALAHGLLYLPPGSQSSSTIPTSAIHAPITLFPTPIPRRLFEQAQKVQSIYNNLYARVALDDAFLDKVMGAVEGVGRVDDFVGRLWAGWKKHPMVQSLHLGLFRSDYLLHEDQSGASTFKQVEFNTISSSFGPLSSQTAKMHRYLLASTGYYGSDPVLNTSNMPVNNTLSGLVEGLVFSHRAYGNESARILFVVQDGERNIFDQRWLEYELLEKHSIRVLRKTLTILGKAATLERDNALYVYSDSDEQPFEISTVYYRAGYTPDDYPTESHYETRFLLNSSRAIQCPSIPLQLAGGKKVQEVLSRPGVLEDFLLNELRGPERFNFQDVEQLRASWMDMWSLDLNGDQGVDDARSQHQNLVLKPQREGGGNNIYKESIPTFLDGLKESEREAWIAMKLIQPPQNIYNWLIRAGGGTTGRVKTDIVSEVGIFGYALFGKDRPIVEEEAGWLVRTKGRESDEGGVAVGFSVLDSIILVD